MARLPSKLKSLEFGDYLSGNQDNIDTILNYYDISDNLKVFDEVSKIHEKVCTRILVYNNSEITDEKSEQSLINLFTKHSN